MQMPHVQDRMQKLVSLAKRRGFIFPSSEIYGGIANTWDYVPLGVALKNNVKQLWWNRFVHGRNDMVGMDAAIFMNPRVWEASGHVANFADARVDCKKCKSRFRADHLVEEATGKSVEGKTAEDLTQIIGVERIVCPSCGAHEFTEARNFNLLFETSIGKVEKDKSIVYLRGETAQGMFVNFKNVQQAMRLRLPFGMGQIGKAFRNEITPGNFTFRTLEFEQMEIEYFISPRDDWGKIFALWEKEMAAWLADLGISKKNIRVREHAQEELSHYSKKTIDFEYAFPFGWKELYGLAYRTDFDLQNHMRESGEDLRYTDPDTQEKYVPHVVEPTFGVDRTILMLLLEAYVEIEGGRTTTTESVKEEEVVLRLDKRVAPVKVAVLPLSKKEPLAQKARELAQMLRGYLAVQYDETGSIGKRYRRQDEIGTPYCVTVDFDSLEDDKVTVRDRDTMAQERVAIEDTKNYFKENFGMFH